MSVLDRLASALGRRDEAPNQEVARELVVSRDRAAISEIAANLWSKDRAIQADCIKVLYEIGAMDPVLIADYVEDFVRLLRSKNNRLVWGGMTALAEVAKVNPQGIFKYLEEIKRAKEAGSVITVDNAISVLAHTAAASDQYNKTIFPYLLEHLAGCRPKEVPQHAERTLPAVNSSNKADFIKMLAKRIEDLSGTGLARVKKVMKLANTA